MVVCSLVFVDGDRILFRSTVSVVEGAGNDRTGDVVDFHFCFSHLCGE